MIPSPAHLRRALGAVDSPARIDRFLWTVSIVASLGYLVAPGDLPSPLRATIKALGVGLLCLLVLRQAARPGRSRDTYGLAAALGLSTLGDIFLALRIEHSFVLGLGSFLLAHLTYVGLFINRWRRPLRPPVIRLGGTVAFLIFSLFFSQWLSPGLGDLAVPVMIYVCAITIMVVSSLWANFSTRLVVLGATLFMISDSILAADKFRVDVPWSGLLIWTTYYLGQYGIAIGFLMDSHQHEGQE
ncbi:MAG: lysoplasmalogenase [Acidobacteriota bacterium]